jgi:hypothetical protein
MSDEKKDGLPPFVQNDDSANMIAVHAAQRRRAYAAALESTSRPLMPIVLEDGFTPIVLEDGSTPIVVEPGSQGASAMAAAGGFAADPTVLSPWVAVRPEMFRRLDAIEAGLRELAPVIERFETAYREHARIGHNNPPEDIDILPIDLAELELGIVAANLARTELNAEQPRSDVMRFCGLVLRRTTWFLGGCLKWIAEKGDVYVDGFLKALGPLTATALVAKMALINTDIAEVVSKIRHVLEVVQHLSF